jgi:cytochrome c biogenesis protein CcmG/thiol:disulfide interchange protein DsbE
MVPSDELDGAHNRSRSRRFLPVIIVGAGLVAVVVYSILRPAPEDGAVEGRQISFELPRLDGSGSVASADLRGTPVVLNFWASWCAPCTREMPMFERVHKRVGNDIAIIGVDVRDVPQEAKDFVEEYGITYEIVRDPDADFAAQIGIDPLHDPLPQTFFLDAGGRLSGDQILGEVSEEQLVDRIEQLVD